MEALAQGGLGPIPNDLFTWWQVLIILAYLITPIVIVAVAVFGFTIWAFRGHPPESRLVRADMALAAVGTVAIGWIVAVAIVVDPNSGPAFWRWIWPVVLAGAGVLTWLAWRQRKTPTR